MAKWGKHMVFGVKNKVTMWWLKYCCNNLQSGSGMDNNQYTTV